MAFQVAKAKRRATFPVDLSPYRVQVDSLPGEPACGLVARVEKGYGKASVFVNLDGHEQIGGVGTFGRDPGELSPCQERSAREIRRQRGTARATAGQPGRSRRAWSRCLLRRQALPPGGTGLGYECL